VFAEHEWQCTYKRNIDAHWCNHFGSGRVKRRDELVARNMNSAAVIKQERQDDLRRATRTIAKRGEKCIEVDGEIFEHLI
jgi:hypothetical protein